MNLDYNKQDAIPKPISSTTVASSEYNQIAGSLMHTQNTAGLTPDANDLTQITTAINKLGATASMPSTVYEDLTLGASGTQYTAPATGWVFFSAKTSVVDGQIQLTAQGNYNVTNRSYNKYIISILLPISKGKIFTPYYDGPLSNVEFRFIYSEGTKQEAQ